VSIFSIAGRSGIAALNSVLYAFVRDLSGAYKYDSEGKPVVTAIRTRPTPLGLAHRASAEAPKETRTFLLESNRI
jgi:hypothetical protein